MGARRLRSCGRQADSMKLILSVNQARSVIEKEGYPQGPNPEITFPNGAKRYSYEYVDPVSKRAEVFWIGSAGGAAI
jgi:hypothetical protein